MWAFRVGVGQWISAGVIFGDRLAIGRGIVDKVSAFDLVAL